MKKAIISSVIFFFFMMSTSQTMAQFESAKQIYKAPNYKDILKTHQTVAILPIKATITYKKTPKDFNAESNAQEEKKLGANMQQGMYTYLLRKESDYTVKFQDVERTNVLLKKADLYDKLDEILSDSICKILNVDAVIRCTYNYEKTASETGAIVSSLLLGSGKTGSGGLVMQINDKKDGELVWRFYKEMNESITSNANEIMERMMSKVSRNFPYKK
jgi:hypothetical protein